MVVDGFGCRGIDSGSPWNSWVVRTFQCDRYEAGIWGVSGMGCGDCVVVMKSSFVVDLWLSLAGLGPGADSDCCFEQAVTRRQCNDSPAAGPSSIADVRILAGAQQVLLAFLGVSFYSSVMTLDDDDGLDECVWI